MPASEKASAMRTVMAWMMDDGGWMMGRWHSAHCPHPSAMLEAVDQQPAAELGLEAGGLRRHQLARVRDVEELVGARRVHREREVGLARVDEALELPRSA